MITFGYKKSFTSIIRALIAVGLGLVLFLFKEDAVTRIVQIIGIAILFAGMISLAPLFSKNKKGEKPNKMGQAIGWTTCGIAAVIGLLVVLKPDWFTTLFIFIVAIAIIVFCTIQLIALISAMNLAGFVALPLVLTCISLVGAIVVMFFAPGKTICIVTGILLIIYGVSEIMALMKIKKTYEMYIVKYGNATDAAPIRDNGKEGLIITSSKEVDFEEVRK